MNEQFRRNLISIFLIVLIVSLLVAIFFIYQYAQTEGFKCLQEPMSYALNHTEIKIN